MIFLDAIVVKVRDGGHVRNKAAHLAIGIDMEGIKHVLGIWVQANQGTTFWAAVCAELAAFEATELGRRYPSTSKAFRDARGAVHALPRVPARTAACDLYNQLDRVAQPPAAEDHPGTAATSQTITRSLSCSGWRSATSKTNRARDRAKERGLRTEQRKAPGRLVEGQVTTNWKQALQQLSLVYPDRINPHL